MCFNIICCELMTFSEIFGFQLFSAARLFFVYRSILKHTRNTKSVSNDILLGNTRISDLENIWNSVFQEFGNLVFGKTKPWSFGTVQLRSFVILQAQDVETLKLRSFVTLERWNAEIWNFGTSRLWNFKASQSRR